MKTETITAEKVTLVIFGSLMMLFIVTSNLVVLFLFGISRRLRKVRYWFIASLAIADTCVGAFIMPLTVAYKFLGRWELGQVLCEMWLAADVLLCTASILHICVIGVDRYWSLVWPLSYRSIDQRKIISALIALAWLLSCLVAVPPLFGWRPPNSPEKCELNGDAGYIYYSAIGSFYLPVFIITVVYARVFYISYTRWKAMQHSMNTAMDAIRRSYGSTRSPSYGIKALFRSDAMSLIHSIVINPVLLSDDKELDATHAEGTPLVSNNNSYLYKKSIKVEQQGPESALHSLEERMRALRKKELQMALFLSVMLGCFLVCWAPFFVVYLLDGICCHASAELFDVFFFLGYLNSGANPIIYALFNNDFKVALTNLVYRRKSTSNQMHTFTMATG